MQDFAPRSSICRLLGEDRKRLVCSQNDADDPNVWSGRALQEDFDDPGGERSCINVSGLCLELSLPTITDNSAHTI
jgi:hypothetical protein